MLTRILSVRIPQSARIPVRISNSPDSPIPGLGYGFGPIRVFWSDPIKTISNGLLAFCLNLPSELMPTTSFLNSYFFCAIMKYHNLFPRTGPASAATATPSSPSRRWRILRWNHAVYIWLLLMEFIIYWEYYIIHSNIYTYIYIVYIYYI